MRLFQVKKGQFVYYHNELYQVYYVKLVFRKSVHLYRLKDMQQIMTRANEIRLCQPKHMDTFILGGDRYTIDQTKHPEQGNYILIVRPKPDVLDHYTLNEIEQVDKLEEDHVTTTRDNGVRHNEYVVMTAGKLEASNEIAYYDSSIVSDSQLHADETSGTMQKAKRQRNPAVGDIYYDAEEGVKVLVVARGDRDVVFGNGDRPHLVDLLERNRYSLINSAEGRI